MSAHDKDYPNANVPDCVDTSSKRPDYSPLALTTTGDWHYQAAGWVVTKIVPLIGTRKGIPSAIGMPRAYFQESVKTFDQHFRTGAPVRVPKFLVDDMRNAWINDGDDTGIIFAPKILAAIAFLAGTKNLAGTEGLVEVVGLVIDPDETRSWRKRGMLSPGFSKKYEGKYARP